MVKVVAAVEDAALAHDPVMVASLCFFPLPESSDSEKSRLPLSDNSLCLEVGELQPFGRVPGEEQGLLVEVGVHEEHVRAHTDDDEYGEATS